MVFNWTTFQLIVYVLLTTHITVMGVTIFLHRFQAHRSLVLHSSLSHFFRFWLWLTTGIITKEWVAVHRKHHVYSDREGDPHSPKLEGVLNILFKGWWRYYRCAISDKKTLQKYGKGTPDDVLERFVYARHSHLGLVLYLSIQLYLFGTVALLMWVVQLLWIPFWAAGMVNGVGHFFGYRNFDTDDYSRNFFFIGLFAGGEELHNNHHAFSQSAKFSVQWWEFDIAWQYIKIFSFLGLAEVKNAVVDLPHPSTVRCLGSNYVLQFLRENKIVFAKAFEKKVGRPFRKEFMKTIPKSKKMSKKVVELLGERISRLTSNDCKQLEDLGNKHCDFDMIYQLKCRWNRIIGRTHDNENSITPEKKLQELRRWCQEALQSEIAGLVSFSEWFRSYLPDIDVGEAS